MERSVSRPQACIATPTSTRPPCLGTAAAAAAVAVGVVGSSANSSMPPQKNCAVRDKRALVGAGRAGRGEPRAARIVGVDRWGQEAGVQGQG